MVAAWNPTKAPQSDNEDIKALAIWVEDELDRFQTDLLQNQQAVDLRPLAVAPLRPTAGMVVSADGAHWDPGSGEGTYTYSAAGTWQRFGATLVSSVFGRTGAVVAVAGDYTFAQIGATPTTLAGYGITDAAPIASPTFTGDPKAPTAAAGDNDTSIATTAFVNANSSPGKDLFCVLSANFTLNNALGAQKAFNATTNGAVAVAANTTYEFEGEYAIQDIGVTSHTWGIVFGGTATITSGLVDVVARSGGPSPALTTLTTPNECATNTLATILVVTAAIAAAGFTLIRFKGIVRINAAGTWIPQVSASAAPGTAPVMLANSFFRMVPLGSGSVTTQGTWT